MSTDHTAPPATMGGPAEKPGPVHATEKEGPDPSLSPTTPSVQGTYTKGGATATPPKAPPEQTGPENASPPIPPRSLNRRRYPMPSFPIRNTRPPGRMAG